MKTAFKVILVLVVVALWFWVRAASAAQPAENRHTEIAPPALTAADLAKIRQLTKRLHRERVMVYSGGLLLEGVSNATSAYTPGSAFVKSAFKHIGVQMQVKALQEAGAISGDPAISFWQGFVIGL
jgi:hypothetical protein